MEQKLQRLFFFSIFFSLAIKIFLAMAIPLTGDEAYFVIWGRHLDYGYYDHTPMAGWIMHLMLFLGSSEFFVRFPAIISSILVGIGVYLMLKPFDKIRAYLLSILFLVSPINILSVLVSTDTLLVLFSFISAAFLFLALRQNKYLFYFLSGAFLGLSFLSKYFAVLLGIAYFAYFILTKKSKEKTIGFLLLFLSLMPFVAINIYWNYTHSWANIMFNLFSRAQKENYSILNFFLCLIIQGYFFTPAVLYYLIRKKKELFLKARNNELLLFFYVFAVPLALLCLLSFKKTIGLHWMLSFYPFLYIILFIYLSESEITKAIEFTLFFTLAHLIIVATALSLPPKVFSHSKFYYEVVLGKKPQAVLNNLKQYERDFVLTTPSYTDSAILSYHSGRYFSVFDTGTQHGRQDDFITNFKDFDGRNILVLKEHLPDKDRYEKYFQRYEIKQFEIDGAIFYAVLGFDFNFSNYRDTALKEIREKYYTPPKFLPFKTDYFREKYFS